MLHRSPHILNSASNLLGFSFLVLASIKGLGLPQTGFIDEYVSLLMVIYASSCILSFVSLRSQTERGTEIYETWADYVFLVGLVLTAILAVLLAFDLMVFGK